MPAISEPSDRWSWPEWLVVVAVAAPFVIAAIALLTGPFAGSDLVGDNAINQLRISDVGHRAVLIGPYSRGNWSHLGPAMYYLLAVPYRVFGSRAVGILVGVLALNAAAALGMLVLARTIGGRLLMLLLAVAIGLVLASLGPDFLRDPWNPFLTVLPFGTFLMACWALASARWWLLPVVVVIGTYCAQTHVAYLPLVGPLAVWALAAAALSERRLRRSDAPPARPHRWLIPVVTATALFVVMWIPPVIDQLTGNGNLEAAWKYLVDAKTTRGASAAWRVVGDALTFGGGWVTGAHPTVTLSGEPASVASAPVPLVGIAFLIVAVATWRRQDRVARLGVVMIAVIVAASFLAIMKTTGPVYDYRLRFLWLVTALVLAVGLWLLLRLRSWGRRLIPTILVIGLVAVMIRPAAAATTPNPPAVIHVRRMNALTPQVLAALPPGSGPYVLRTVSLLGNYYQAALLLRLEQHDRIARLDAFTVNKLAVGEQRLHYGPARDVLIVAVGPTVEQLATRPDLERIALWSPEGPARVRRDLASLRQLLARPDWRLHPALVRRVSRLTKRTNAVAIYRTRR